MFHSTVCNTTVSTNQTQLTGIMSTKVAYLRLNAVRLKVLCLYLCKRRDPRDVLLCVLAKCPGDVYMVVPAMKLEHVYVSYYIYTVIGIRVCMFDNTTEFTVTRHVVDVYMLV